MLKLTFVDNLQDLDGAIVEFARELGELSNPASGRSRNRRQAAATRRARRVCAGRTDRPKVSIASQDSSLRGPQAGLNWFSRYLASLSQAAGFEVASEGLFSEGPESIHL